METTAELWLLLEVSIDVHIAAVLSQLRGFFTFIEFSLDNMFPPALLHFIPAPRCSRKPLESNKSNRSTRM